MKKDSYNLNSNIESLYHREPTSFLNPKELMDIKYKIKDLNYNIYKPYPSSDKVILYIKELPKVCLFEIISYNPLRHQDILGSLFAIGISDNTFGDIIITDNKYYFYCLKSISRIIKEDLINIGNNKVEIQERNIETLNNYEKSYLEDNIIVSSLRIDNCISTIIGTSRNKINELIKDKQVLLNYDILTNNSYILKENDVFSIRKYGKYQFKKVIKTTKKDSLLIDYIKYI